MSRVRVIYQNEAVYVGPPKISGGSNESIFPGNNILKKTLARNTEGIISRQPGMAAIAAPVRSANAATAPDTPITAHGIHGTEAV